MVRHTHFPPGDERCEGMSLVASPILFILITLSGMSYSLLGTMLPEMSRTYHLTASQVSSLPLAQFLGDFSGLIVLGLLLSRPRALLIAGALLLAASALTLGFIASFSPVIKVTFFFYGAATAVLVTIPGMIVARLEPSRAARTLNLIYAFFSVGVMAAPLIAGAFLSWVTSYRLVFMGFGILAALGAGLATFAALPCPELGTGLVLSSIKKLLVEHRRLFLAVCLMTFFYVAAETVPNAYIPKYLSDTFTGASDFRGALVLSLFWGAITLGRFICATLLEHGAPPRLTLAGLAVLSGVCLLLAAWTGHRLAAEILFAVSGLFLSGMFPILVGYSGDLAPSASGSFFILVQAVGMLGASMAGKAVGVLTDTFNFSTGMTLAVPLALLILVMIPLLPRKEKEIVSK